jgi:hypothetical protein
MFRNDWATVSGILDECCAFSFNQFCASWSIHKRSDGDEIAECHYVMYGIWVELEEVLKVVIRMTGGAGRCTTFLSQDVLSKGVSVVNYCEMVIDGLHSLALNV